MFWDSKEGFIQHDLGRNEVEIVSHEGSLFAPFRFSMHTPQGRTLVAVLKKQDKSFQETCAHFRREIAAVRDEAVEGHLLMTALSKFAL